MMYRNDCRLTCLNQNCDIPIRFRTLVCQMNENRPISAESQHNFHCLPHFNSKTNEPIFTIFTRGRANCVHPQDDSAFRFRTREQMSEGSHFDVCKNRPKLIGYLGLLRNLCSFIIRIYTSTNVETLVKTGSVVVEIFGNIGQIRPSRSAIFIFSPTLTKNTEPVFIIFTYNVEE